MEQEQRGGLPAAGHLLLVGVARHYGLKNGRCEDIRIILARRDADNAVAVHQQAAE